MAITNILLKRELWVKVPTVHESSCIERIHSKQTAGKHQLPGECDAKENKEAWKVVMPVHNKPRI